MKSLTVESILMKHIQQCQKKIKEKKESQKFQGEF